MEGWRYNMAQNIEYPTARTFWKITRGELIHEGFTDINQVTATGDLAIISQSVNPGIMYPALPTTGWLVKNTIYSYNGDMMRVVQSHNRTVFEPSETPDLFDIVRSNTEGMEWVKNEKIEIGDKRDYNDITYQAINSFTTREGQTPNVSLSLWKVYIVGISVWVQPTGAHDAYAIGAQVYFPTENDSVYESKINANVWSPTAYPAGWKLI
jgi:hypothetical protein